MQPAHGKPRGPYPATGVRSAAADAREACRCATGKASNEARTPPGPGRDLEREELVLVNVVEVGHKLVEPGALEPFRDARHCASRADEGSASNGEFARSNSVLKTSNLVLKNVGTVSIHTWDVAQSYSGMRRHAGGYAEEPGGERPARALRGAAAAAAGLGLVTTLALLLLAAPGEVRQRAGVVLAAVGLQARGVEAAGRLQALADAEARAIMRTAESTVPTVDGRLAASMLKMQANRWAKQEAASLAASLASAVRETGARPPSPRRADIVRTVAAAAEAAASKPAAPGAAARANDAIQHIQVAAPPQTARRSRPKAAVTPSAASVGPVPPSVIALFKQQNARDAAESEKRAAERERADLVAHEAPAFRWPSARHEDSLAAHAAGMQQAHDAQKVEMRHERAVGTQVTAGIRWERGARGLEWPRAVVKAARSRAAVVQRGRPTPAVGQRAPATHLLTSQQKRVAALVRHAVVSSGQQSKLAFKLQPHAAGTSRWSQLAPTAPHVVRRETHEERPGAQGAPSAARVPGQLAAAAAWAHAAHVSPVDARLAAELEKERIPGTHRSQREGAGAAPSEPEAQTRMRQSEALAQPAATIVAPGQHASPPASEEGGEEQPPAVGGGSRPAVTIVAPAPSAASGAAAPAPEDTPAARGGPAVTIVPPSSSANAAARAHAAQEGGAGGVAGSPLPVAQVAPAGGAIIVPPSNVNEAGGVAEVDAAAGGGQAGYEEVGWRERKRVGERDSGRHETERQRERERETHTQRWSG